MSRWLSVALGLLALASSMPLLSACGQKGPLYLPAPAAPASAAAR